MPLPIQVTEFTRNTRWQPCKNVGATTISAYGCVEVTGITDDPLTYDKVWTVQRPTSATPAAVAANGPGQIVANAFGVITFDDPFFILVDAAVTPAVGTTLGPTANQFDVDTSGSIFVAQSTVLTSPRRCLVRWAGGGGGDTWGYGVTDGTITAATGTPLTSLGSGNVLIYDDNGAGSVSASATTEAMWNTMHSVIDDATVVQWVLRSNGEYYITAVDCV